MFFRADTLKDGFNMFKIMVTKLFVLGKNEFYKFGLDMYDVTIVIVGLLIVLAISILKEKNINVREEISKKNIVIRWIIFNLLILSIIILGAYGPGYAPVDPIYADF
jgi:hypothetical protein